MKKITLFSMLCACSAILASCAADKAEDTQVANAEGKVPVKFTASAPSTYATGTKAMSAVTADGFRILAFRQDPASTNYYYYGDIDTSDFTVTTGSAQHAFEGTAYLDYGDYKFLPTYGLRGSNVGGTLFSKGTTVLSEDMTVSMGAGATALPEIFMDVAAGTSQDPIDALAGVNINLAAPGSAQTPNPVNLYMNRAVGRVDVYFVKSEYDENNNLVEVAMPVGENIFGNYTNDHMKLHFTNVNGAANYFSVPSTDPSAKVSTTYNLPTFQEGQTVIAGQQTTISGNESLIGGSSFSSYDNIQPENVVRGGYYFVGPYFFGQQGEDAEATLSIEIQNIEGLSSLRNIPISTPIPVKRNMVTIVKVNVLAPHVYATNAQFIVEVDTVWDGSETVSGILN